MSSSPHAAAPRWARVLDYVVLLLFVIAVIIAMSGGFRIRILGVPLAVTSPIRLLVWAGALAILRHLVVPRPPMYRDLPPRLAAAWRRPSVQVATASVVGTRAAVLFVGYLAVSMLGFQPGAPPWRVVENEFGNLQARWDVGWYLSIAIEGYTYQDLTTEDLATDSQQNIVFFPALPLLMRGTGRLLGGTSTAYLAGGTAVVLFSFLGGLVYLYRFARDVLEDDEQARRAVWLLSAYPFAVYYSAVYTESVYLLGAVGAFYHFRRHEYWKAGAWGLLVGLTRPNGCFLSIPLALLAITPWLPAWVVGGRRESDGGSWRRLASPLAAAAMPGIGVLSYTAYIWYLTGRPLAWATGHGAWGRTYQGLSVVVADRVDYLARAGFYEYTTNLPYDLLQALGVLFVLFAAWPVARRLGLAYAVFILINILPPLAAGQLLSAGRFSAVLFPAFVWLGGVVTARQWPGWVASFMAVQALNAALFYTWRPMF